MPNDERRTPRWLFHRVDSEFDFTVAAAASHDNAYVARYWTKAENETQQDWSGHRVWCNPPNSRGQRQQGRHADCYGPKTSFASPTKTLTVT
jgi:phage N-6-adenine-methyltransferase